ncbi:MAG: MFS transporter [Clostridia bacterium]
MKKIKRAYGKLSMMLFYRNDMQLITAPGKPDRDWFIKQAIFGTAFGALVGGIFLSGLFIELDAPDYLMGYIPYIGSIAGITLIFAGLIIERVRNRKKFIVILNLISKSLIVSAVWIPLFIPRGIAPYIMIFVVFWGYSLQAFMGITINSWFVDVIDERLRGRFMSTKQIFALVVSAVFPVVAGRYLDLAPDRYVAFCVIYSVAWIFMWLETHSFTKITEPGFKSLGKGNVSFKDLFLVPLKNKAYLRYMTTQSIFYFSWHMTMSFASVYQLRYLEIPYTFITVMGMINPVLQMAWYPMWGRLVDKYGSRFILRLALWMYVLHAILWFFMTKGSYFYIMPLLQISAAMIGPAFMLGTFNTKYSIIPQEGRSVYDGFFTSVVGFVILISPAVGNLIKIFIENNLSGSIGMEFPQFRLMFALAAVLVLLLNLYHLASAKKTDNLVKEKLFLKNIFGRTK